MAKSLNFRFDNHEMVAEVTKVDRKKIYGYTRTEVMDRSGSACMLASISADGKYILPSGTTGITNLDHNGGYISRTDIRSVDLDGKELEKHPSSFDIDINLEVASLEEYLNLNVKAVYELALEEDENALLSLLKDGKIFKFLFSYRSDYNVDDAFLIQSEEGVFVITGSIMEFDFVGLESKIEADEMEEADEDDFDSLDMGMF